MRKLYVHAGPTKTGTSAIQSLLCKLEDSAVIYPKAGRFGPRGSHHGLVRAFFGRGYHESSSEDDIESLLDDFASNVRGSKRNVLISSESLLRAKEKGGTPSFIRALLERVGGESWDVEILFGCRDHFERAASAYSQRLKQSKIGEQRDPDEFLLTYTGKYEYEFLTRSIRDSGFRVTALNYHPSATWIARFLGHIGIAADGIPEPEYRNTSLSTKALIAKLAGNRVLRGRQQLLAYSKSLKQLSEYNAPAQFIFGARAAAEAESVFSEDRAFLLETFGVALPKRALESLENMFFISAEGLADIAGVTRELGDAGNAIVDIARQYVRAT